MSIRFLAPIFFLLFVSCSEPESKSRPVLTSQFRWLEGHWEMQSPDGMLTEEWKTNNDSLMSATSVGKDSAGTIFFDETITLEKHGDEFFYITVVADQNDGKPVSFKLVQIDSAGFTAENLKHDFPQRIIYRKNANGDLNAAIEGMRKGKICREEFPMKRKR